MGMHPKGQKRVQTIHLCCLGFQRAEESSDALFEKEEDIGKGGGTCDPLRQGQLWFLIRFWSVTVVERSRRGQGHWGWLGPPGWARCPR